MFGSIFNQKKKDDEAVDPVAGVQQGVQEVQQSTPVTATSTVDPAAVAATVSQDSAPAVGNTIGVGAPQAPGEAQTSGASDTTPTPQPAVPPATDSTPAGEQASATSMDMSSLGHLDPRATQVLTRSQEEAKRIKQQAIEPDQVLIGLLSDEHIYKLLEESQVNAGTLSQEVQSKEKMGTYHGQPILSKTSQQLFEQAYKDAKLRGSNFVSPEDLLEVMFLSSYTTASYLQAHGLQKEALVEKFSKNPNLSYGKKTVLEKYGVDLTEEARQGHLDPVAGREKEVDRITHILLRRTKNNPIIIGETGVGKTAIVEGLAQQIVSGQVPKDLQDKRVFQLDVASLVAGASHRGEFEERLRAVITEVLGANNKIILFIDEIHSLMGTGEGEGMNAANIIKPHLARGHFQLIGATTTTEYRKNFEKDKAFERRFQPVIAEEPSEENAFEMLKVLRAKYEKFHRVTISDDTLKECVKLSKKYIGERYLPDKAIDLLDEAASHVKLQGDSGKRGDTQVKKGDIEAIVSSWTGIPVTKLTEDESEKLLKLEDRIHKRMIDQEEAVVAVSEAVRRGRIGLASGQRPIASFIFLGPTGVGKTELAKTLAELLFGRDDAMARLDMSEYMEKHEVAKLIGAPPGYVGYEEGGVLTEAVRKKPYCIVLMDEIEKAHPDVFNILLQLLEDGRLTDNKGNTISFKNTIVICTSNIGSSVIMQKLSTQDVTVKQTAEQLDKQFQELQKLVKEELTKFLRPEVLNRFDEVVIFKPLRPEHMAGIVRLGIAKTAKLLKEQGYGLQITEKAVAKLAKDGYDPVYGARPLRRLIQTVIENPIALAIISKKFTMGDVIVIDYSDKANEFVFTKGGQAQATTKLSDEEFKLILQKIANPDTVVDPSEKGQYSQLHDKAVTASTGGDKSAASILAVNAATGVVEIQAIRKGLEDAKSQGNELAKEILEFADTRALQKEAVERLKKVLLQVVDPALAETSIKQQCTELHEKLSEASANGNTLAANILAVTAATPADSINKLMSDLTRAKDEEDELARAVLTLLNTQITAEAEEARASDPAMQYKKVLQQVINPLYLADPANKDKFSQLYDKLSDAAKQNHKVASAILALTDITSDDDIANIKKQLEQAKANGDPLAKEVIETIETEIKRSQENIFKKVVLLVANPDSAATPEEKDQYTRLHERLATAKGDLAKGIIAVTAATNDADIATLKEQFTKAKEQNDEAAMLLFDAMTKGVAEVAKRIPTKTESGSDAQSDSQKQQEETAATSEEPKDTPASPQAPSSEQPGTIAPSPAQEPAVPPANPAPAQPEGSSQDITPEATTTPVADTPQASTPEKPDAQSQASGGVAMDSPASTQSEPAPSDKTPNDSAEQSSASGDASGTPSQQMAAPSLGKVAQAASPEPTLPLAQEETGPILAPQAPTAADGAGGLQPPPPTKQPVYGGAGMAALQEYLSSSDPAMPREIEG